MTMVCTVNVAPGLRYECEVGDDKQMKVGDEVLIQFERCQDNGVVAAVGTESRAADTTEPTEQTQARKNQRQDKKNRGRPGTLDSGGRGRVVRHLTLQDKSRVHEKQTREQSLLRTAARKVKEHSLPMKMLNCHYTFDRTMVFFQFVADGRVDFRALVKDLSGAFKARVELRQVGVRDEASLVGGIGCCGRPFCCATVLNKFPAVNVKAAKEQRLSLNPSSVSGSCGRLKCCLRYELDGYRELNKMMPRVNARCQTEQGSGKVMECNVLTQCVRVLLDGDAGRCAEFPADQVKIERG